MSRNHYFSVLVAFFVTLLWSSSWVLIKVGLDEISPLVFAGLRYVLAGMILSSCLLLSASYREEVSQLSSSWWIQLVVYGIFYYAITQGSQFLGLFYLPAITVSFLLNLTSVVVLLLAIVLLREYPSSKQLYLMIVGIVGVILFFYPITLPPDQLLGVIIVVIGVIANALSSVMGRSLNQVKAVSPFVITTISMMVGSILLLGTALVIEGVPDLSITTMLLIIWLAVVNTALAFVMWNYSLQELTAVESSLINSTMLPQITILAMVFFDEGLILKEWVALFLIFLTGMGISLLRDDKKSSPEPKPSSRLMD